MLSTYIYIGAAIALAVVVLYIIGVGKDKANQKIMEDRLKALEDAKEIRDKVDSMSDDDKREWLRDRLQR